MRKRKRRGAGEEESNNVMVKQMMRKQFLRIMRACVRTCWSITRIGETARHFNDVVKSKDKIFIFGLLLPTLKFFFYIAAIKGMLSFLLCVGGHTRCSKNDLRAILQVLRGSHLWKGLRKQTHPKMVSLTAPSSCEAEVYQLWTAVPDRFWHWHWHWHWHWDLYCYQGYPRYPCHRQ